MLFILWRLDDGTRERFTTRIPFVNLPRTKGWLWNVHLCHTNGSPPQCGNRCPRSACHWLAIYHFSLLWNSFSIFTANEFNGRWKIWVLFNFLAVHCPRPPDRPGLHVSSQSNKMNTKIVFSCKNGNALLGPEQAVCLPSGNWSAPAPVCESKRPRQQILFSWHWLRAIFTWQFIKMMFFPK